MLLEERGGYVGVAPARYLFDTESVCTQLKEKNAPCIYRSWKMSRILIAAFFLVAVVLAEKRPVDVKVGFCAATIRGSTYDLTAASHNG